jgi:hypothetical protein
MTQKAGKSLEWGSFSLPPINLRTMPNMTIIGHTHYINGEDPLNPDTWKLGEEAKKMISPLGIQEKFPVKPEVFKGLEEAYNEHMAKKALKQAKETALSSQVGGTHYSQMPIQPVEFITKNNLSFLEGNVIKYVCRWKNKNGIADLEKAKHYIDLLIELEGKK